MTFRSFVLVIPQPRYSKSGNEISFWFVYSFVGPLIFSPYIFLFGFPRYQNFTLHKKWSFPLRVSSVNVAKSTNSCGFGAGLVTFTGGILSEKLHFLCSVNRGEKGAFPSLEPWNIGVLTIDLLWFYLKLIFRYSWTRMADISG